MTILDTILNTLLDELKEKLSNGDDYNIQPNVFYGKYTRDQVEVPALCIGEDRPAVTFSDLMGDSGIAYYNIVVYGYARWDGIGDSTDIRKLALDFIRFVKTDFTYRNTTLTSSDLLIDAPGPDDPIGAFIMTIQVGFDYDNSTINQ